jgi:hypothetical protein
VIRLLGDTPIQPFVAAPDAGGGPSIAYYQADGSHEHLNVFETSFTGGVRVAMGDFNSDGIQDTVVGTGPGIATEVRIIDGRTNLQLWTTLPFESTFTGGVYVAAGDMNGDGIPDIAISPDEGGGPRVRLFDGKTFEQINDFFGIDDPNFRGGARAALGDLNGDGWDDLLVAAGFGGGPRLAGFDAKSLATDPAKLFDDFFVFEQSLRNGVFVTSGDLNADGFADLVAGGGPGGAPRVYAISGRELVDSRGSTRNTIANFFAGDTTLRGGVRLAIGELDGDGRLDLITGPGPGGDSKVTAYSGSTLQPEGTPIKIRTFDPFPDFTGGVFVG